MSEQKFEQWAIVELFGHQKIAGLITEQTVGGCAFVRVDVPALPARASQASYDSGDPGQPAFTKLFGQGAIYAISFVAEEIARAAAASIRVAPITPYEIPELRQMRLPGSASSPTDGDGDGDGGEF